jgi:hypothetical protein
MNAFSEAAFANAEEGAVHHLQQLALVVALAEQKFFGVRTRRAIGDILRRVFVGGAAIGLRPIHRMTQFLLPRL